jgi:hypothetical protein
MKVVYPGHLPGYHVVGRRGVGLKPGVNDVDEIAGIALIASDIVIPIEDTHHRKRASSEAVVNIGDVEPIEEGNGRAEGGE